MEQETGEEPAEKKEDDDDEDEEKHHGVALVACDQSAITGESLAVDKYMGDTCYYTTGCKRGKAVSPSEFLSPAPDSDLSLAVYLGKRHTSWLSQSIFVK